MTYKEKLIKAGFVPYTLSESKKHNPPLRDLWWRWTKDRMAHKMGTLAQGRHMFIGLMLDGQFRVFAPYGAQPITIVSTVEKAIALVVGDMLESGL